jgi:hypothetical protein
VIKLLLKEIKDIYVQENFIKIRDYLNKLTKATSHEVYTTDTRPLKNLKSGDTIYNNTTQKLNYWDGDQWVELLDSGGAGTTDHALLTHLAYSDAGHTGFQAALGFTPVPNTRTVNGKALSTDISLDKIDIGLGNVDNTSDADKPISSATQTALNGKQNSLGFTPEDVSNKDTTTTLGTSDTKYPSQNAVKTYVDTGLGTKQPTGSYEVTTNKENTTIDNSTTKYPTVNLLKTGLATKQDTLIFKTIYDSYEMTIYNGIIVVKETDDDIIITLPSIRVGYKKIFNIVNESDNKVTLLARGDDKFYTGSGSFDLNTKGESIQVTAYSGWNILAYFIP